jgi:hypothetical protein
MDPNKALQLAREGDPEALVDLDAWLCNQGALPKDWRVGVVANLKMTEGALAMEMKACRERIALIHHLIECFEGRRAFADLR